MTSATSCFSIAGLPFFTFLLGLLTILTYDETEFESFIGLSLMNVRLGLFSFWG